MLLLLLTFIHILINAILVHHISLTEIISSAMITILAWHSGTNASVISLQLHIHLALPFVIQTT